MNTTELSANQRICDVITELQTDLERLWQQLFEQAGQNLQPEKREAAEKEMKGTKELLERLKRAYG